MSGDFIIDPPGKQPVKLAWMPSGAHVQWVVEVVAERVADPGLAAELRKFVVGDYSFFALSMFSAAEAAEIMRVIRESVPGEAERQFPGNDVVLERTAELVALIERAEAAPDAK
ncbi:hypothetical protein AB0J55_30150 [Amycolatopsis sp. NPDC049688]|uniref:hypothetical protein n=1 Tax=Amycolatopsis sp. NPDC049688 TaxID=3154733 RepID=UPI00341F8AD0